MRWWWHGLGRATTASRSTASAATGGRADHAHAHWYTEGPSTPERPSPRPRGGAGRRLHQHTRYDPASPATGSHLCAAGTPISQRQTLRGPTDLGRPLATRARSRLARPDHHPAPGTLAERPPRPRPAPRTCCPRPPAASPAGAGRLLPPRPRLQLLRAGRPLTRRLPSVDRAAHPPPPLHPRRARGRNP